MAKKRKTKQQLGGFIQSGTLFIGDAAYMADGHHHSAEGIVPDPLNPFKDLDAFAAANPTDTNLPLPGSDLPGRGTVIQTNMLSGSYKVKKTVDKVTGKLKKVTIEFKD